MKIVVHDYSGHPFQVELSRSLASRGHEVTHLFSSSFQTPKGALHRTEADVDTFSVAGISHSGELAKYSYVKRRQQEIDYGKKVVKEIQKLKPDIVLSGNTPLDAQKLILRECKKQKIVFLFWVQDFYSVAIQKFVKIPIIGKLAGWYYARLEGNLLNNSDGIIIITTDFLEKTLEWNVTKEKISVIPNWAPIGDMPSVDKKNTWSLKNGLDGTINYLYSGTLGLKHNPQLLVDLAERLEKYDDARVIVVSEGQGAEYLKQAKKDKKLKNLVLMGFQRFEDLPKVFGTADVLISILEKEAGQFSVPSKVLSYLCAGRTLLLSVPIENLAAQIVKENMAGIVVSPDDNNGFVDAAEMLLAENDRRVIFGRNARGYAERNFDIDSITDKFETSFNAAIKYDN